MARLLRRLASKDVEEEEEASKGLEALGKQSLAALDQAAKTSADPLLLETGKLVKSFPEHGQAIRAAVYSPDGRRILSGDRDGTMRLWDVRTGQELRHFAGRLRTTDSNILGVNDDFAGVESLAFSPDSARALSGHSDRTARLWDVETGKELACYHWHFREVNSVAISPDGTWALSGSRDQTVRLWALPK